MSSKKDTKRSSKKQKRRNKKTAAQAKIENAEAQTKSENAEAEAKEAVGEFSEIKVRNDVEAAGGTGEGHPGHRTVNEEAGHIVIHVEHVEHGMDERTESATLNEETCREGEATMEYKR